jgi:putative tricarboxylic transport membrane protein
MDVSHIGYQDVTPLAIMMREYVAVWTRAESPIASAQNLIARLKKDPSSVSFGLSPARGNQNHIVLGMVARAAGIDPKALKIVVYSSGGAGMTAALGGHVDVWAGTAGGALRFMPDRRIRVLGLSSAERQPGRFADVETFREQGVDAVYYAWRGYLGPTGLTHAQTAFWDEALASVVSNDAWKAELEKNAWGADFKRSAETRKHLESEHALLEKMLTELGLVKR